MTEESVYDALASGRYAFADLGCGSGGSIDHCLRRFGVSPGLGVEFEQELVEEARRNGYDALQADVTQVRVPERSVRYVSMMDFLEHLPDEPTALGVLERFSRAARDFIFIRHPSFEEMAYLESKGVRLCWTDWTGHPNMMLLADFERAFERFGWTDYRIFPRNLISDSTHNQVVAFAGSRDIVTYDAAVHPPKPLVRFDRPIYAQFDIFVRLNPALTGDEWEAILASGREADPRKGHDRAALYTPADSRWHLRYSNTVGEPLSVLTYGAGGRGWLPFVGDFDGDGSDGLGVYDPSTGDFFLRNTVEEGLADVAIGFGAPGGIPVAGDWTGSGVDTIGVYYPENGQWFLRFGNTTGPADAAFSFGPARSGWLPVAGDWDGDGVDSVGLYDPVNGVWYLRNSITPDSAVNSFGFGLPGLPVVGDWDGDGVDTVGVYEPDSGEWFLRNTNTSGPADFNFHYFVANATPLAGHWKGR